MLQRATPTIKELLSYRLHQVANLLSRGAELRYRREFGVSLWEWRTIALLGGAALFTMNPIDVFFWTVILSLAVRILAGGDPRLWLALGW